jgi:hypothetical protein
MKRFLKKARLSKAQEIALLCGGMALLVMAAVFISGGGMERAARAVAENGLSPYSLTAGIFPCSWTDSCAPTTTYYFSLTAGPGSIVSGQAVLLTYTAGSRSSDGVVGNYCDGNFFNKLMGISCTLTDFGTVYSPSGSMTGSVYAYPTATRTYTLCQTGVGAKCTSATVYVTQPAPSAPTTLVSLKANPAAVTSGSPASLAWTGAKGTNFSACRLVGGQWGSSGAWFTAHPGSISTSPLTTTTTYNMACYDTNGASTPWRSATVTVTAPAGPDICTDVPGVQNSLPSGCAGPVPSPAGACIPSGYTYNGSACVPAPSCTGAHEVGTPPNCACDVGYQMQGGSCVQVQCPGTHEVNWPACSCDAGYARDAATNTCVREPELDITVNGQGALRVRRGSSVQVAWSATGVTAGSCRVTTNAGATLAASDSGSRSVIVDHQTAYTLSCSNDAGSPVSKEANATLIPEVIEQ